MRWGTTQILFGITSSRTLTKYAFVAAFSQDQQNQTNTNVKKQSCPKTKNRTLRSLLDFVLDSCVTATCKILELQLRCEQYLSVLAEHILSPAKSDCTHCYDIHGEVMRVGAGISKCQPSD